MIPRKNPVNNDVREKYIFSAFPREIIQGFLQSILLYVLLVAAV